MNWLKLYMKIESNNDNFKQLLFCKTPQLHSTPVCSGSALFCKPISRHPRDVISCREQEASHSDWLPVTHCIQYKISAICFSSISGTAPQYLSDLLQPYTPARQLWSASDTRTFVTPRVNTKTFGERSFSYAGPSVWNNLPQTLRHSDSTSSFKAALKTHLFNNYF